jgi:hypothetical protein
MRMVSVTYRPTSQGCPPVIGILVFCVGLRWWVSVLAECEFNGFLAQVLGGIVRDLL